MLINKIILTFIFAGIYSVANAQNLNALDDNNGFQNYKFGMHKNNFERCQFGFENVEDGGAERCFILRDHKIGDMEVPSVELFFVDSSLSKIKVNVRGKFSDNIRLALISAFGSPTGESYGNIYQRGSKSYSWQADTVKMSYHYYLSQQIGHDGRLYVKYSLNNYDELQKKYRSKKYTPADF